MNDRKLPVCAVVGVGPGNGASFARVFAAQGYAVALLSRSSSFTVELAATLTDARAYECDVSDGLSVERAFEAIRAQMGDVDILIYNAGRGVWGTVEDVSPADFEASWRVNTLGAFLACREVIPAMKRAQRGSIVFVGATASRRGAAKTAAFAPAKAAQRSLAESMAKHLWPAGIHIAVIIVDGAVNVPAARRRVPDKPESFFIQPDDVAATAFWLTQQRPSAWSFEVEARPFGETW